MKFTTQQVTDILAALQGNVDAETYSKVSDLLELNKETTLLTTADSYANIRGYSQEYLTQLNDYGHGVVTDDPEDELLMVYMEKSSVSTLLSNIPSDGYVAALPGIHLDSNNDPQLTISLLGTNSSRQILSGHIDGTIDGLEDWPHRGILQNLSTLLPTPL